MGAQCLLPEHVNAATGYYLNGVRKCANIYCHMLNTAKEKPVESIMAKDTSSAIQIQKIMESSYAKNTETTLTAAIH